MLYIVFAERPEIVNYILPQVKLQDETAYLNCSVINLQSPGQLHWVKQTELVDFQLLSSGETVHTDDEYLPVQLREKYDVVKYRSNNREIYQLIIRSLGQYDTGNYTCLIALPNQSKKEWPQTSGSLTVLTAPIVWPFNDQYEVPKEGKNITLLCEADGNPAPNITWKRGDGSPVANSRFQQKDQVRCLNWDFSCVYLELYQVEATDRGDYICIADNNIEPPASVTYHLEVRTSLHFTAIQDTVGQAQNRRFDAKLECLVAAYPRARVIWYKDSKYTQEKEQIQDDEKYGLKQQDDQRLNPYGKLYTLTIRNVQGNDYGYYYCTGRNKYEEDQVQFLLFETMECQGQDCPSWS
ncbi:Hypothetical predicted protein [Mytilus galloprovincialis]|nr:Hypothetical predicted protein [Mytilus galloprovincialis]